MLEGLLLGCVKGTIDGLSYRADMPASDDRVGCVDKGVSDRLCGVC